MTLTLHLTPEIEAKLREESERSGKSPEELALKALQQNFPDEVGSRLSAEEWTKQFHDWVNSHRSRNPNFDDSRDSIYPDRW